MKQRIFTLSIIVLVLSFESMAQQLPLGTCGIVNVYDDAGNRTKRVYFCNNGIDPYPMRNQQPAENDKNPIVTKEAETKEFQYVDALYPNPTTGQFFVIFSKNLSNASISILDNTGKTIAAFKASGNKVDFDLSPYASGMYYVRIEEDGKSITKKVIKQ